MTKRIVIDAPDELKASLEQALAIQGESVKDWFSEQLHLTLASTEINTGPWPPDVSSLESLDDEANVFSDLARTDWSFEDADTGYLTHDIHPYPAKFIPQIPAHLISKLSTPGELVLDPFGGSGTTATEAARLRRRAVSVDANPLAVVIGKAKAGRLSASNAQQLDALSAAVQSHAVAALTADAPESPTSRPPSRASHWIPDIPNLTKWFSPCVAQELAIVRHLIDAQTNDFAQTVALTALSRIVVRVSNQDSETRYVAREKNLTPGLTFRAFLEALKNVRRKLQHSAPYMNEDATHFLHGDARTDLNELIAPETANLIVSSPPYPNATDYHLYHRFRMFWLGFDPRALAPVEIGSHLKHQRENNGFDAYCDDMRKALNACYRALQPGRYAAFVVGNAVYKGASFATAEALRDIANDIGFRPLGIIERQIHTIRRSFSHPARRARTEGILVLRKPDRKQFVRLFPPTYKMWPYEETLRTLELQALAPEAHSQPNGQGSRPLTTELSGMSLSRCLARLTFTSSVEDDNANKFRTWQKILENGDDDSHRRKEPKYATHGLHAYKGKFYPQLAKALINIAQAPHYAKILDPYCGSGTVPLECLLNGYRGFGLDMHPLAAKIGRAKTAILATDQSLCRQAIESMLALTRNQPVIHDTELGEFPAAVHVELTNWFPAPVLAKMNWLLSQIRLFGDPALVEFFEIVLSSVVRDVSQQDPRDLRIRRRATPISDAPVIELFHDRLAGQYAKLRHHWNVRRNMPFNPATPRIAQGDARDLAAFNDLGLAPGDVDLVLTSPPYATALPYIDTDRLSLLAIMGIDRIARASLERDLTGSREFPKRTKSALEHELLSESAYERLPAQVVDAVRQIYELNASSDAGFRKQNMAALLWRYFCDMKANLSATRRLLRQDGKAFYVVGDSRTQAGGTWIRIETCQHLCAIAQDCGFKVETLLDITVTKDNFKHSRNAITKNKVLAFSK